MSEYNPPGDVNKEADEDNGRYKDGLVVRFSIFTSSNPGIYESPSWTDDMDPR